MRRQPVWLFPPLLLTLAWPVAHGATTLGVEGRSVPGACVIALSGQGTVDYGMIPSNTLVRGAYKQLPRKQLDMSITCEAATRLALNFIDNRAESRVAGITGVATDFYNYGLGSVAGKNVGGYALLIDDGTLADGATIKNIFSSDNGGRWHAGTHYLQHEGQIFSFGIGGMRPSPQSFVRLRARILVDTYLNKPEELPSGREVRLDGFTTIDLLYL